MDHDDLIESFATCSFGCLVKRSRLFIAPNYSLQYYSIPGIISRNLGRLLLLAAPAADRCYDQAVATRPPMSEEQLKAFLEKVKGDTSLQEKLKATADSGVVLAIAKDAGFSISAEDLTKAQSEVSDKELESAAGGCTDGWCLGLKEKLADANCTGGSLARKL